jgi:hypothetical protein
VILKRSHKRALTFIAAANDGGYRPKEAEVEEWRLRPDQLPGKKGELLQPAIPGEPPAWTGQLAGFAGYRRFLEQVGSSVNRPYAFWQLSMPALEQIVGKPGKPAVYAPDGPPETLIASMIRLGWLNADAGLALTRLGRALLRAEEIASDSDAEVVLLEGDNPLAYGALLGRLSEATNLMVVDPYLRAEQLLDLLKHTDLRRVLIGDGVKKGERVAMQTLLSAPSWSESVELRIAERGEIHDRIFVSDLTVNTLGTSMNGVGGRNMTLLLPVPPIAADKIREDCEKRWAAASVLASPNAAPGTQSEAGEPD